MKFLISKTILILTFTNCYLVCTIDVELKNGWFKPSAFKKPATDVDSFEHSATDESKFSEGSSAAVLIYYKKLLNLLFDRTNYKENNNAELQRTILFKVKESELNLLETSTDPRDWDEFVTNVFENAESVDSNIPKSYFNPFNILPLNSSWFSYFYEMNIFTITIGVVSVIFFLHTRYHYNLIALILFVIFAIGYFNKYMECNSELAIENLVSILDHSHENPCEGIEIEGNNIRIEKKPWYNFWGKRSKKEECADYLRKQHKRNEETCSPYDVFLKFIYDTYMKQFEMIIFRSSELFQKIMKDIPFPLNILAAGMFGLLMTTFLTLFFKYVIAPLISKIPNLKDKTETQSTTKPQKVEFHEQYHELFRLQSDSINNLAKALTTKSTLNITSGVQIIEQVKDKEIANALNLKYNLPKFELGDVIDAKQNDTCEKPMVNNDKLVNDNNASASSEILEQSNNNIGSASCENIEQSNNNIGSPSCKIQEESIICKSKNDIQISNSN